MFQNEEVDEYLNLEELNDINGVGLWNWIKDKVKDAADWIKGKLSEGDGKHEWKDDYRADAWLLSEPRQLVCHFKADTLSAHAEWVLVRTDQWIWPLRGDRLSNRLLTLLPEFNLRCIH